MSKESLKQISDMVHVQMMECPQLLQNVVAEFPYYVQRKVLESIEIVKTRFKVNRKEG